MNSANTSRPTDCAAHANLDATKASLVTLRKAFSAHRNWKFDLVNSVVAGERLDVENIRSDRCCFLGKWLYDEGARAYQHRIEFTDLLAKHKEFHEVASVVAQMVADGGTDMAMPHLSSGSQFAHASVSVSAAIIRLTNVLKQEVQWDGQPG